MKLIYVVISLGLLYSCNSSESESEKENEREREASEKKEATEKQKPPVNCYLYATATDTVSLKLIHVGQSITGTLLYHLKEKDKNKGTIQGVMKDNLLIADYSFMSEGMQSVRQVVFKLEGNGFVEGYGDIDTQNNKVVFKHLNDLKFNSTIKLAEIDCQTDFAK